MIAMNPALCLYQRKSTLNLDNLHLKITFLIDWQLTKVNYSDGSSIYLSFDSQIAVTSL